MKIILTTFCLVFLLSGCAKFFVPNDYSDCILSEEVPESYKSDCEKFGMNEAQCAILYKRKINLKKHDKLKSIGIDLSEAGRFNLNKNYKERVLYSDAVIHGVIKEVVEHGGNVVFRKTFKIKIKDVLKGRALKNRSMFL